MLVKSALKKGRLLIFLLKWNWHYILKCIESSFKSNEFLLFPESSFSVLKGAAERILLFEKEILLFSMNFSLLKGLLSLKD